MFGIICRCACVFVVCMLSVCMCAWRVLACVRASVCACVCVCMHVCICMCVCVCVPVGMSVCVSVCLCVSVHLIVRVCAHPLPCAGTPVHVCGWPMCLNILHNIIDVLFVFNAFLYDKIRHQSVLKTCETMSCLKKNHRELCVASVVWSTVVYILLNQCEYICFMKFCLLNATLSENMFFQSVMEKRFIDSCLKNFFGFVLLHILKIQIETC